MYATISNLRDHAVDISCGVRQLNQIEHTISLETPVSDAFLILSGTSSCTWLMSQPLLTPVITCIAPAVPVYHQIWESVLGKYKELI